MKHRCLFVLIIAISLLLPVGGVFHPAGAQDNTPTSPKKNGAQKWRIGYLEGGTYRDYEIVLKAVIQGMVDLGWMSPLNYPVDDYTDHRDLWNFVAANTQSPYLEFVQDAFYTSGFDKEIRPQTRKAVIDRLNNQKDIDLMIAMGTWAGQDLATDEISTPTIVASSSDPIRSGIVKSADDSGYGHLWAKVSPDRFENHIRLFHQIIGFKKLGVVYEDSVEGRTYSAMDDVEKLAPVLGYEIVECHAPFSDVSQEEAEKAVVACYTRIAPHIDAAYITVHSGVTMKNLANIMPPLIENKVYTYSMAGSDEVRHGVLMSIALAGYKHVGAFYAESMAKILNGAMPGSLNQKWVDPPKIALNLKTAEMIGWDPDFEVLAVADEIFEEIEKAK